MPGPEKYKQSQMKKIIVIADVIMSLLAVGHLCRFALFGNSQVDRLALHGGVIGPYCMGVDQGKTPLG